MLLLCLNFLQGIDDADDDSDSDGDVGAQAPPLTKQISDILNRYPEGGQILKVFTLPREYSYN